YSFDPSLDTHASSLRVSLNGSAIGTLSPKATAQSSSDFVETEFTVPANQLVRNNALAFEFIGGGLMVREEQGQPNILAQIDPDSTIEVSGDRMHLQNDLAQLPLPIFDPDLQT